jgi:hypothetical protein
MASYFTLLSKDALDCALCVDMLLEFLIQINF